MRRILKLAIFLGALKLLDLGLYPYHARLPLERLFCGQATATNFYLVDDGDFERLGKPVYGDWLWHHPESGQSFWDFIKSKPEKPTDRERRLVLQPLGDFNPEEQRLLEDVGDFCQAFFDCEVRLAPSLPLPVQHSRERGGARQYKTPPILREVLAPKRPEDAFCYLGVTAADLTYADNWNYVYGSAMMKGKVGVFSLARYFPEFYGQERTAGSEALILRRSCGVMAHEAAHSLGLEHCLYYRCLMQGSNHLGELDEKPLTLCPICLAKLKWSLDCDLERRYERLRTFCQDKGLSAQASWFEARQKRRSQLPPE